MEITRRTVYEPSSQGASRPKLPNVRASPGPTFKIGTDVIGACFLFEFGNDPKDLKITDFDTGDQEAAILRYADAEQRLSFEEGQLAPILVSVNSVDKLPVAYQTFFLDCSPYVELLKPIISPG
jgi:hypothetical protein